MSATPLKAAPRFSRQILPFVEALATKYEYEVSVNLLRLGDSQSSSSPTPLCACIDLSSMASLDCPRFDPNLTIDLSGVMVTLGFIGCPYIILE